jgi:sulfite reductase (NADPH) flavoprotein alpha-component
MNSVATPISGEGLSKAGGLSKFLAFKSQYDTKMLPRPDVDDGELVPITDWRLLTPEDYDRTCFHWEIDVRGTRMENLVNGSQGKALSVYATNPTEMVQSFIHKMGLNPLEVVPVDDIAPPPEDGMVAFVTLEKLFTVYLDLFGRPTREFLKQLHPFANDIADKVAIAELTLDRKVDEFQEKTAQCYTYADYILEFKSLCIPAAKYLEIIPTIKQRVYSICSSSNYRPGKCQLLVVREDWQAKGGNTKYGLCSSFLTFQKNSYALCHSTHSVMQMPADNSAHIFMAGLGTGLAPFRAFVEERKWLKESQGKSVGPMTLFFGGRYSKSEYYYKDEFDAFEKEGLLKCCNAWSRDQAHKIYVQHKIMEEADSIWEQLGKVGSTGYFFLCGSKQPEKDVFAALLSIMQTKGGMSEDGAQKKMDELAAAGRYVTEVY